MTAEELVRAWKDPDERGDVPHPAGEIVLGALNGGVASGWTESAWDAGLGGETVLGGNSCLWCIPEPLPFRGIS
jgi:hypothetical protein